MKVSNFLFHRVNDHPDPFWPAMLTSQFRYVLKRIKNDYTVIRTEELLSLKKKNQHHKFATISFDDGYEDNLEYAAPILKELNLDATFFIVSQCIEQNEPTWTYITDYRLYKTKNNIDIASLGLPLKFSQDDYNSPRMRIKVMAQVKLMMKQSPHSLMMNVVKSIVEQTNDVQIPAIMMNWKQVNQLHASGFCIGSHTHTHPLLQNMENDSLVRFELTHSKELIKQNTGADVLSLAYPVGGHNERVKNLTKESGYKFAMAVNHMSHNEGVDMFAIPRIELYNEAQWKTNLRMNEMLQKTKKILRNG